MSAIESDEVIASRSMLQHGPLSLDTITSAPAIGAPVSSTTREPTVAVVGCTGGGAPRTNFAYGYVLSASHGGGHGSPQHSAPPSLRTPQNMSRTPESCANAAFGELGCSIGLITPLQHSIRSSVRRPHVCRVVIATSR